MFLSTFEDRSCYGMHLQKSDDAAGGWNFPILLDERPQGAAESNDQIGQLANTAHAT